MNNIVCYQYNYYNEGEFGFWYDERELNKITHLPVGKIICVAAWKIKQLHQSPNILKQL